MVHKYQVSLFYFMYLVNTGGLAIFIAQQFCAEKTGQPLHRNGRRKTHTLKFEQM